MFLRFTKSALLMFLLLNVIFSTSADAQKVVRVGWYDSPFNYTDSFGRRLGYSYDYQQKIAAYAGWTFEYVNSTWPVLLDMLKAGQIDLMSDVSYTPERAGQMLFSSLPMGAESYYIYASVDHPSISLSNTASLNGKKIGVSKNSYQRELLINWLAANGISAEIVDLSSLEQEAFQMMKSGELDAYVTLDVYEDVDVHAFTPLFKIGESNFFSR